MKELYPPRVSQSPSDAERPYTPRHYPRIAVPKIQGPVVYRYYDADDRLLYVGSTRNLASRHHDHKNARWRDRAVRLVAQAQPTVAEALAAELRIIQAEVPSHNRRGLTMRF